MLFLSGAKKLAALVYEFKPQTNRLRQILVFSVFALLLPVALSVITIIIEPNYGSLYNQIIQDASTSAVSGSFKSLALANDLLRFVLPLLGLVVQALIAFSTLIKGGYLFFYLFFIIPGVISLFGSSINIAFWVVLAIDVLLVLLTFVFVGSVRDSLVLLIKPKALILILIAGVVVFALTIALNLGGGAIFPSSPDNESRVRELTFVQTLLSAGFVAPFVEEFVVRRTIYANFAGNLLGNITGAFAACFFFAFMHIQATNDWKHIFSYLLPSIPLTLGLVFLRNAFPSSIGHLLSNLTIVLVG